MLAITTTRSLVVLDPKKSASTSATATTTTSSVPTSRNTIPLTSRPSSSSSSPPPPPSSPSSRSPTPPSPTNDSFTNQSLNSSCCWAPDNSALFVSSPADGKIRKHDPLTGRVLCTIYEYDNAPFISSSPVVLLSATNPKDKPHRPHHHPNLTFNLGNEVFVLQVSDAPKVLHRFETGRRFPSSLPSTPTPSEITSLALSNDGSLVACVTSSSSPPNGQTDDEPKPQPDDYPTIEAHIHNLSSGSHSVLRGLPSVSTTSAHKFKPLCAFHPHARTRLLLGLGEVLVVYDTARPSAGPSKVVTIGGATSEGERADGEDETVVIVAIASSPFSKTLVAVACSNGTVGLIDLEKEKGLFRTVPLRVPLTSVSFSPEGASLYAGTEDGKVLVLDLRALDKPPKTIIASTHGDKVTCLSAQRKLKPGEASSKPTTTTSSSRPSTARTEATSPIGKSNPPRRAVSNPQPPPPALLAPTANQPPPSSSPSPSTERKTTSTTKPKPTTATAASRSATSPTTVPSPPPTNQTKRTRTISSTVPTITTTSPTHVRTRVKSVTSNATAGGQQKPPIRTRTISAISSTAKGVVSASSGAGGSSASGTVGGGSGPATRPATASGKLSVPSPTGVVNPGPASSAGASGATSTQTPGAIVPKSPSKRIGGVTAKNAQQPNGGEKRGKEVVTPTKGKRKATGGNEGAGEGTAGEEGKEKEEEGESEEVDKFDVSVGPDNLFSPPSSKTRKDPRSPGVRQRTISASAATSPTPAATNGAVATSSRTQARTRTRTISTTSQKSPTAGASATSPTITTTKTTVRVVSSPTEKLEKSEKPERTERTEKAMTTITTVKVTRTASLRAEAASARINAAAAASSSPSKSTRAAKNKPPSSTATSPTTTSPGATTTTLTTKNNSTSLTPRKGSNEWNLQSMSPIPPVPPLPKTFGEAELLTGVKCPVSRETSRTPSPELFGAPPLPLFFLSSSSSVSVSASACVGGITRGRVVSSPTVVSNLYQGDQVEEGEGRPFVPRGISVLGLGTPEVLKWVESGDSATSTITATSTPTTTTTAATTFPPPPLSPSSPPRAPHPIIVPIPVFASSFSVPSTPIERKEGRKVGFVDTVVNCTNQVTVERPSRVKSPAPALGPVFDLGLDLDVTPEEEEEDEDEEGDGGSTTTASTSDGGSSSGSEGGNGGWKSSGRGPLRGLRKLGEREEEDTEEDDEDEEMMPLREAKIEMTVQISPRRLPTVVGAATKTSWATGVGGGGGGGGGGGTSSLRHVFGGNVYPMSSGSMFPPLGSSPPNVHTIKPGTSNTSHNAPPLSSSSSSSSSSSPPPPPTNPAQDLLSNLIRDALYDFRRETKAEIVGLHLDLVNMGRGWKREMKESMERWGREMDELREENRKLKEENERLRGRLASFF